MGIIRPIFRTLPIVFMILTILLSTNPACAQDNSDALEITDLDIKDGYAREVSPGGSTTYRWTLKNVYEYNMTIIVHMDMDIKVEDSGNTWNVSLTPSSPVTLSGAGDAQTVTLSVVAPPNAKSGSADVTVTFTAELEQGGAQLEPEEDRNAFTSLTPIEEEEKVMDLFENPLPEPLDKELGIFLLTVGVWLLISVILLFILDPCVKAMTKWTKTEIDDIILKIVRTPMLVLIFFYGVVSSLDILEEQIPSWLISGIDSMYGVVFWLVILYVAYKLFKDILVYYGQLIAQRTSSNIDDVVIPIVEKIGVVVIGLVAFGYILGYLNIDLTMFVAGGVVVSMVIAFAAQETLSNFFSGIFILTDRPFKEGDTIILPDGDWYEVRDIGLRSTQLFRFKDASMVHIPNNNLAGEKIINYTNPDDNVRVRKTIGVAYGTDVDKVRKILNDIFQGNPHIITDEAQKPNIRFDELGESSLNFFIQVIVDHRDNKLGVIDYLNTEIYKRFNQEGIEIPYPQRVIHMRRD